VRGGRLLEGETTGETLTSRRGSRCRETRGGALEVEVWEGGDR
jgi:hypothetical protein